MVTYDLPEIKLSRWTRIRLWRRHRQVHRQLSYAAGHMPKDSILDCAHCRQSFRSFGGGLSIPFKRSRNNKAPRH